MVLFDEPSNDYLHRKQMDAHVRCWDSSHKVTTRYYNSVFIGYSTAGDIQGKLLSALLPWPLEKIHQISIDGRNVNLEFFKNLQVDLQQTYQVMCMDICTCDIHTMHNAYRAGVTASTWGLDCLLSILSALFESSLARGEDFATVTGLESSPLKFALCNKNDTCNFLTTVFY